MRYALFICFGFVAIGMASTDVSTEPFIAASLVIAALIVKGKKI